MKIDPYCQQQHCNPLNVLFSIMFLALICRRFLRHGPSCTPCRRVLTLTLARVSRFLKVRSVAEFRMSAGRLFHTRRVAAVKARSLRHSRVRGTAKWLLVTDQRVICHWLNHISDVRLVHRHAEFELDVCLDWQPVQVHQCFASWAKTTHQPGS